MEQDDDDYESRSGENFEGEKKVFFSEWREAKKNEDGRETKELRKPNVPRVLVLVMSPSKANWNTLTRQ